MSLKRNIIIAILSVVLCIVALVFTLNTPDFTQTETGTENKSTAVVLLDYEINSFVNEKIVIESEKPFTLLRTVKDNGAVQYVVDSHKNIEFIDSSINNLANNFSFLQMADTIEKNAQDLSVYGLDNPQGKYTLYNENGNVTTVLIGNKIGSMYYSMVEGKPDVYTLYEAYGNAVLSGINNYRNKTLVSMTSEDVANKLMSFSVNKGTQNVMSLRLINENDKITSATSKFIMTSPYNMPIYTKEFLETFNKILPVEVEEFIEDNPVNLSHYGLSNPAYTVTIEDESGFHTIIFGNTDGSHVYCMLKGKNYVFTLPKTKVDALAEIDPYFMCDRYAHLIDITDISSVEVKSADGTHNYTLKIDSGATHGFYFNGYVAEEKSFRTAYRYITGMALSSDGGNSVQKNKEALRIVFNFTDGTTFRAIYYEYDDRNYSVDRNGEKSNFLVAKKSIEQMYEQINKIDYIK